MPLASHLLVTLLLAQSPAGPMPVFHADETLSPPGGPEVAIFRSVAGRTVSLRLSIPMQEEESEAGAGQFIQIQAQARMRTLGDRIGARAEVHRTPQAMVYQISGPVAELDFLGWILSEALEPPSASDFEATRRRIQLEHERRLETPQGVLAGRMRAALSPENLSVFGSTGSVSRIDPTRLTAIWRRSHTRENARLVVAGRAPTAMVLALVADLGLQSGEGAGELPPAENTGSPEPSPELIRHWIVEGRSLLSGDEASALVLGRWLAQESRMSGEDFEIGVEIWDVGGGRALVVTGAAYPRSRRAMESYLAGLFAETAEQITEDEVARLSAELRTEIIIAARTPWGLAELVGQAWDAGNGPDSIEGLVSELDELTHVDVIGLVRTLAGSTPVREEMRP